MLFRSAAGSNGQTVADAVNGAGNVANAARWDASTNAWVAQNTMLTWNSTNDDRGLDGVASTGDFGEGDGFPPPADPAKTNAPGEPNVIAYRLGAPNAIGASDNHYWTTHARWWGNDNIDNNNDGSMDGADIFEQRTYTIRAAGIYQDQYTELETFVTRDPPQPAVDPNNPPSGFLAAISVQVAANSGAPAGNVNIFNPSAPNSVTGVDTQTNISGASSATASNNTSGVLLAASGASLTLAASNPTNVTGTGGTPSFNNSGAFIGPIIDTISDAVKAAARDTSGNPSDNANNQSQGSATSLKLVYHDFDRYGTFNAGPGFGILVVDATDITSTPAIKFTGAGSTWEGIVIVRVKNNLAPTGPNGAVQAAGAGPPGSVGQMGSVVVYAKSQANFSGGSVYKNNGNRPTQFSMGAVQAALSAFVTQTPPPPAASNVSIPISWRPIRAAGLRRVAAGE